MPIEINCRPPGSSILDMMNGSIEDDLYRAYAFMMADVSVLIRPESPYCFWWCLPGACRLTFVCEGRRL